MKFYNLSEKRFMVLNFKPKIKFNIYSEGEQNNKTNKKE